MQSERCLSVLQVIVDYAAVLMCLTDHIDEPPTRRTKSSSAMRSAHRLSHHDRRCKALRVNVDESTWQLRRQAAVNGRPTIRCAVIERTQDVASEVRERPGAAAAAVQADDDGLSAAGFSPTLMSDVREVRRLMSALQSRMDAKDAAELVARDWRLVATCLDRILFCVYCVVVALSLVAYFPRSEA